MKKTLIAIAALAATSAFAQSSVTMSGNLDFAFGNIKAGTAASESTVSTRDLTASTSVIKIVAVEDLGGGTKATVQYGIDPRLNANDSAAMGRDETFVGLSGKMGNLRLGAPNSIGLTTFLAGSPFGTGIGGGYASQVLDYSFIRHNRSARYDSPAMGGLTVSVLHATGADAAVGTAIPAATSITEAGLSYANGPLTVAYANIGQGAYGTGVKTNANVLSANYNLGATTLYVGMNDGDATARGPVATGTKGSRLAVKQTMGQIDLMVGVSEQKAGSLKEKVTGLRADYNLSKTAVVYAAYEKYDGQTNATDKKSTSVGIRKSF